MEKKQEKRWHLDYEVEKLSGGVFKASTLRKDRLTAQRFPFHRVGDRVLYDLAELNALVERSRYGGSNKKRAA